MDDRETREPPPDVSAFTQAPPVQANSTRLPARIGTYRPLRILGEGGMGVVYEAEQIRPRRVVALKVIRPGLLSPQMLRRFELEAEVLGRLQHPGIAQVFEAGTAETDAGPQPFFAMELVRGPRLDRYVAGDERISTRSRIELLIKICDAVQYAHQKGVIHRDLKPGNILVDDTGQPKILDFGVARVTDSDVQATMQPTSTGQVLGTLQYMAPEQARGDVRDVDTAADVYALGVVAYEILGGRPPYLLSNRSLVDAVRVICDEEPSRLSMIDRTFRGDLETIVRKAMEKDKNRRYATAAGFASDLRHYLNNEPIAARRPGTFYQLRKFAARNRAFTTGVVAVFVGLLVTTYIFWHQGQRIREEQKRTLAQKEEAEHKTKLALEADARSGAISQFLERMLKSVNPGQAMGKEPTVRQVLDDASTRLDTELKDQPLVAAALRYTIGDTYVVLGHADRGEPHLRTSFDTMLRLKGPDDRGTITAQNMLAFAMRCNGKYQEAEPLARDALERSRRVLGPDDPQTMTASNDLCVLLTQIGKLDEAEPLAREVIAQQTQRFGPDHPDVLSAIVNLSYVMSRQGRDDEVDALLRDAVPRHRRVKGEDHPDTLTAIQTWAVSLMRMNKLDEAEPLVREVLERRERVLGKTNPDTLETKSQLGVMLARSGTVDEGITLQREVLEERKKQFGPDHPATIASVSRLAMTLATVPNGAAEAITLYQQTLQSQQRTFGPDHLATLRTAMSLAGVFMQEKRAAEAEPLLRDTLDRARRTMGEKHPLVLSLTNQLAACLEQQNKTDEAKALRDQVRAAAPPTSQPQS